MQHKKIILCAFVISGLQVQLLSPAPFKAPESVAGSGVFLLGRGCPHSCKIICGKKLDKSPGQW